MLATNSNHWNNPCLRSEIVSPSLQTMKTFKPHTIRVNTGKSKQSLHSLFKGLGGLGDIMKGR